MTTQDTTDRQMVDAVARAIWRAEEVFLLGLDHPTPWELVDEDDRRYAARVALAALSAAHGNGVWLSREEAQAVHDALTTVVYELPPPVGVDPAITQPIGDAMMLMTDKLREAR